MGYHIFETPDHLHRGLHLFAIDNLHTLLGWLSETYAFSTSGRSDFFLHDRWLLWDAANLLKRQEQKLQRLPQSREVKRFLRRHPEFAERPSHRIWKGPESIPCDGEVQLLDEMRREYEGFEARSDERDWPVIVESIRSLQAAIDTESIEEVCAEIENLREMLGEGPRRPKYLNQGLDAVYDLLSTGLKCDAWIVDEEENEAFEVTKLCKGSFRGKVKKGIAGLRSNSPIDLENVVAELLAQHGLQNVKTTRIVADGGIDITATHVMDGNRLKYIIQCKRNAAENKVDVSVVRELVGAKMDAGAAHALLITTSEFTKPAKDFARRSRAQAWGVRLIDYKLLERLLQLTD